MKTLLRSSAFIVSTLILATAAHASEKVIPCTSLPSAVQDKGKSVLDGATVHACQIDITKGVTTYEMELIKNNRSRDITFDTSGNIVEIEAQVDLDALPAPVKTSILKASSGGKLGKIESLTRAGQIVSYETTVTKLGVHHEIAFHPDGTPMKAD